IVHFPKDPKAGGTWFASNQSDFTLCVLNGGYEKHKHKPPYRLSRGLMVLDFFKILHTQDFASNYNFDGIEPFTLIIVEHGLQLKLHQLVWNEVKLDHIVLSEKQPQIWSSSTLYPEPVRQERKQWFKEWLMDRSEFEQNEILRFHQFGGKGDAWNDFVMDREGRVKTVSVTSLDKSASNFNLEHISLI
ncbi:MAG TPA: NRDE family protein, partial [Roseivirga sp.]